MARPSGMRTVIPMSSLPADPSLEDPASRLRALVPTEPAVRRRVFAQLLRALIQPTGGAS